MEFPGKGGSDLLSCAELPVSGVSQARHYIADLVQTFVNLGNMDRHVGMRCLQGIDPFWGSEQAYKPDALRPPVFEDVHRGHGRTPGGQHGIENKANFYGRAGR